MSPWLIAGIAGAAILGGSLYTVHEVSYHEGYNACSAIQATAQVKQDTKVKAKYDKVDRNTPIGADKPTVIKWLQLYTSPDSK